ncbi:hypothetical protein, partial [Parafrankia soli]|uniref:hypothetical protein n=1 Tax=Parafrankia soli TaxID=2599596 RepID=UPI001042618B
MSVDLATLGGLVGECVHISRPPTPLEVDVFGFGYDVMGGSGFVIAVHPESTIQQSHEGRTESLTGRLVDFDYGYGVLVTAESTVEVDHAAAITEFLVRAARG